MRYVNISPNYVFSVYAVVMPNNISPSHVTEVMKFNSNFWYVDNGYSEAMYALVYGNGWYSHVVENEDIGEFKFYITIDSHPELFI